MNKTKVVWLAAIGVIVSACASNTGVVPMGRDTYRIANTSTTVFASGAEMLAALYQQADGHCKSMSKELMPVGESSRDGAPYQKANADLQFRCLSRNDPELRRPTMEPRPDVLIKSR